MDKLIVAHRGACRLAHENTPEAFLKAIELGADIIELDARKSRDGILIVFHDASLAGKKIKNLNYKSISNLAKSRGFIVPTLEEALTLVAGKIPVHIEIKERGYELQLAGLATKVLKSKNFAFVSFHYSSLKKIKVQFPEVETGMILGSGIGKMLLLVRFLFFKKNIPAHVNFFSIDKKLWEKGLADKIPQKFPVNVWTVDNRDLLTRALKDKRLYAITTNVPDLALELRKENN